MPYRIDHLVISASELEQGKDAMEGLLDVEFGPRGVHADMGTHNHLIALRPDAYLEVIAPDADAPASRFSEMVRFGQFWWATPPDKLGGVLPRFGGGMGVGASRYWADHVLSSRRFCVADDCAGVGCFTV